MVVLDARQRRNRCVVLLSVASLVAVVAGWANHASANPEASIYDTRALAMGLTGTTYLERPAALVLNPANLEGIEKFGFGLSFTMIMVKSFAPVQGPNTRVDGPLALGPIPSIFLAGRISKRVVFSGGVYFEAGFGGNYPGTVCVDGEVVGPAPDYVADTNPQTCVNNTPEDMRVSAFIGEAAVGASVRVTDSVWLGFALRLPFSRQVADLWSNIGAAFGMLRYERSKTDIAGVGFPSPRFGITWKPHRKVTVGAVYRMYSRIKLTGTTTSAFLEGLTGNAELATESEWNIPHMFQVGLSSQVNSRLLLVLEYRMQFHAAPRTGNLNQPTTIRSADGALNTTTVAPFGWRNVWSVRPGVEYRFRNPLLAWRGGINFTVNATDAQWANFRSAPWGFGVSGMTGLGFYWDGKQARDQYRFDLGLVLSGRRARNGNEYIDQEGQLPGTDETVVVCSSDQVLQTGCPGRWGTTSFLASIGLTLQY